MKVLKFYPKTTMLIDHSAPSVLLNVFIVDGNICVETNKSVTIIEWDERTFKELMGDLKKVKEK